MALPKLVNMHRVPSDNAHKRIGSGLLDDRVGG
jgi:hypothetical protein